MTVEYTLSYRRQAAGKPESDTALPSRPARIACLVALAHRFEALVQSGEVKDYAQLARLGHVTRARVTQIMNLLNLAPEIQEYLLWLPSQQGAQPTERQLREIVREVRWDRQRAVFSQYKTDASA